MYEYIFIKKIKSNPEQEKLQYQRFSWNWKDVLKQYYADANRALSIIRISVVYR